ncbi:MAG TPA: enoyl-CoA hydratase-related protein [Steroidobacteraceae bacterium]|nr:enoyl-CoA hydratase-related protein [Steroidobacteraceae bacterium]
MEYQDILYEVDGPVARITLNRPAVHNAQSRRLLGEMDTAFMQAADDVEVRAIVLGGAGRNFSAGHDLGSREARAEQEARPTAPGLQGRYERVWKLYIEYGMRWRELPKPTIAMVQGYCIFGGWMIATAMDLIVAADDAKFLASHFQYFSVPYDVGPRKAKELLFEFRFMHADEAERAGMVNRVVPRERLEEETLALARRIALNDPFALRMAKLSVNQAQDEMGYSTFVKSALQTYMVTSESGAKELKDSEGGGRRRFATVDRALAYEHERDQRPRRGA